MKGTAMTDHELFEARKARALALDIIQSKLHLPLENGKINEDKIHDHIVIGMYSGDLKEISQNVIDMALSTVQEMVDINKNK